MAGNLLQIDDEYCNAMGKYFVKEGQELDNYINDYITILKNIKCNAIKAGRVANALDKYIGCAQKLKNQFEGRAINTQKQITKFLSAIDESDEYLY